MSLRFEGYNLTNDDNTNISENALKGTYVNLALGDSNYPTNFYVFSGENNMPGFYRYSGTLGAYKAYLVPPPGSSKEISGFTIVFDENGEVTGIDPIYDLTNDNLTIDNSDGPLFNLQGQRVNTPKRGIYIVNGKKVVVK